MTQHDHNIENQTFPSFRTDLNNALAAEQSLNSGDSAPADTVAGMLWYETDTGIIWQRNAANSAWVHLWTIGLQGLQDQDGTTVAAADAGSTDAYTITLSPAPTAYAFPQVFRFKANTANTGAATLNVNGLGAKTIKKNYNADLATGDILASQIVEVIYDGTNFQMLSPVASNAVSTMSRSYLAGLALVNGSDANNDIDIQVGACRDSTDAADIILAATLTKQSDAAWSVGTNAGGMDTGTKPNSGTLHVWLIKRSDTGVVDALFSTSATSPTMPSNYDYKRRIGAVRTNSSGNILGFVQYGDTFLYKTVPALDVDVSNQGTTAVTRTLSVPAGIVVKALLNVNFANGSASQATVYIKSPDLTDTAPSPTATPLATFVTENNSATADWSGGTLEVHTNTSGQVTSRADGSGLFLRIATRGWIDRRGRDD